MVLSDTQVKTILVQLGMSEEQITKELIEEIQLNCKGSLDVMAYAQKKGLIRVKQRSGTKQDTIEGILIAASDEPRFDTFFEKDTRKPVAFKDYQKIQYIQEENCYILVESENDAKILDSIEYYIGYMLIDDNDVLLVKSTVQLPVTPQYIKLAGRKFKNMFVANKVLETRELSDVEWDKLNDYIDTQILEAETKMQKECSNEPIAFIGKVIWAGIDNQGIRGVLDQKTAFRIVSGGSSIGLTAYSVLLPQDTGIYIGLLTVKKRVREDGSVIWRRTLLHPVKIQKP